ncbi:MAG: leucine-rich repeat protein [Bacilli bacterium]|nr:leucine-rich repeat protein [Bacilli bacterium]
MLKRKFIISIIFIVLGLLAVSGKVNAADKQTATVTINGVTANLEYTINSNGDIEDLVCKNASELSGTLSIPSTIDGKKVISLGNYAFKGATGVTSLYIPKSLIGDCGTVPFSGCSNITSVTFEDGITRIPGSILWECTGITEITIPNSVTEIGGLAFADCSSLKKVNFGTGIKKIGNYSFENCKSLTSLYIPKSLTENCGTVPFSGCSNITSVTFEDGITRIPSDLLWKCTGITKITIPNSVTEIGGLAFADCTSLKKITILDNVTKMASSAFERHNDDLTIYCYEGSVAAKYAIDNNIKYVYLKRTNVEELTAIITYNPTTSTTGKVTATIKTNKPVNKVDGWTISEDGKTLTKTYSTNTTETVNLVDEDGLKKSVDVKVDKIIKKEETKTEDKKSDSSNTETEKKEDTTVTPKKNLPQTGTSMIMIVIIGTVALFSIGVYSKSKKYRGIK